MPRKQKEEGFPRSIHITMRLNAKEKKILDSLSGKDRTDKICKLIYGQAEKKNEN